MVADSAGSADAPGTGSGGERCHRWVRSMDDAVELLDLLFDEAADRWSSRGAGWWDAFYADRERPVPFFQDAPDESLVAWQHAGLLDVTDGTDVLELGCGPGRNAIWLAGLGGRVDALDLSGEAVQWARERAAAADVVVRFEQADIFTWDPPHRYDLVVDSGCFHHLPPHRRATYLALLRRVLRPGGRFALACFADDGPEGLTGTTASDVDLYRTGSLHGGVAYSADDLRAIFAAVDEVEIRRMQSRSGDDDAFGQDFLWAALFRAR